MLRTLAIVIRSSVYLPTYGRYLGRLSRLFDHKGLTSYGFGLAFRSRFCLNNFAIVVARLRGAKNNRVCTCCSCLAKQKRCKHLP